MWRSPFVCVAFISIGNNIEADLLQLVKKSNII